MTIQHKKIELQKFESSLLCSDNQGVDNRGCTVLLLSTLMYSLIPVPCFISPKNFSNSIIYINNMVNKITQYHTEVSLRNYSYIVLEISGAKVRNH